MARTIHHIDLTVSDMERARRFYKPVMEQLGYQITENTAQEVGFATGNDNATGIMLHPARPSGREKMHDRYSPGLHHLAFRRAVVRRLTVSMAS